LAVSDFTELLINLSAAQIAYVTAQAPAVIPIVPEWQRAWQSMKYRKHYTLSKLYSGYQKNDQVRFDLFHVIALGPATIKFMFTHLEEETGENLVSELGPTSLLQGCGWTPHRHGFRHGMCGHPDPWESWPTGVCGLLASDCGRLTKRNALGSWFGEAHDTHARTHAAPCEDGHHAHCAFVKRLAKGAKLRVVRSAGAPCRRTCTQRR
jgi:hypothetical protein